MAEEFLDDCSKVTQVEYHLEEHTAQCVYVVKMPRMQMFVLPTWKFYV